MSSSKKKITQDELRRLMNEQKKKLLSNVKKIDTPMARYDKDGNLTCVICETIVRSEAVWSIHLNTKNHRQNLANKVKKKVEEPQLPPPPPPPAKPSASSLKRPAPPPIPVCTKKVKSILKNAPPAPKYEKEPSTAELPSNFFDSESEPMETNSTSNDKTDNQDSEADEEMEQETANGEVLPEGFFDDPKLDAKVRNVEYKDPIEEEWEQFQKEIREETSKAQQIISDEQEEATAERQIEEIDEQMRNWSRVIDLEKKKEEVVALPPEDKLQIKEETSSTDEEDFEEFVDWRSKKSFV